MRFLCVALGSFGVCWQAKHTDKPDKDNTWLQTHKKVMEASGIRYREMTVPKDLQSNVWYNLLPLREQQVVGYYLTTDTEHTITSIDVSQRIDRAFIGKHGLCPTVTPGMKTYLVEQCRLLTGLDSMLLQGYPRAVLDEMLKCRDAPSDPCLRELAGNAFAVPVLCAVLIGVLAHLPELPDPRAHDTDSAEDADELRALASFKP